MSNRNFPRAHRIVLAAAAATLSACTAHAPIKPLPDAANAPLAFERSADGMTGGEWPQSQWWKQLGDEQLSALVAEGLQANPDMQAALARIEAAQAVAATAGAPLTPSIDVNANVQRSRLSANGLFPPPIGGSSIWQNKLSLDLRWDLDFWGRQRSILRAALSEAQAVRLESELSTLAVSTAIVRRYIEWQRLESQLEIAQALLDDRTVLLALTKKRVDAGIDSNLQLQASEAAVPQARADVTALQNQISALRYELAALVGAGPDRGLTLQRPAIAAPALTGTPATLPADLLARRADITAQRLRAEAAAARADAAKADFYPNINLAASVGLDSTTFTDWIDTGSRFYNAGPAINLPFFGGGSRRSTLKLRTAEYDQAVAAYRQSLLSAVREVATTLAEMRSTDSEHADAQAAVAGQNISYELTRKRYEAGISNHIEVLVAQQELLNQRRRVVDLDARRLDASVRLVSALGGGIAMPAASSAQR